LSKNFTPENTVQFTIPGGVKGGGGVPVGAVSIAAGSSPSSGSLTSCGVLSASVTSKAPAAIPGRPDTSASTAFSLKYFLIDCIAPLRPLLPHPRDFCTDSLLRRHYLSNFMLPGPGPVKYALMWTNVFNRVLASFAHEPGCWELLYPLPGTKYCTSTDLPESHQIV